jgi:hypothetical protein
LHQLPQVDCSGAPIHDPVRGPHRRDRHDGPLPQRQPAHAGHGRRRRLRHQRTT